MSLPWKLCSHSPSWATSDWSFHPRRGLFRAVQGRRGPRRLLPAHAARPIGRPHRDQAPRLRESDGQHVPGPKGHCGVRAPTQRPARAQDG